MCQGLTSEEEVELAADEGFDCSLCRTNGRASYGTHSIYCESTGFYFETLTLMCVFQGSRRVWFPTWLRSCPGTENQVSPVRFCSMF